ncbi:MAG: MBL fold metallo-hydrolase [Mycobacteriales bacterium]
MRRPIRALVSSAALGAVVLTGAATAAAPAPAMDGRTVALRQKFFGAANVDARTGAVRKDVVILTWASVMTYAAAINGHVVLFDAWVARGEHSGYVPTDAGELAGLKPELVLIGHGHFDHAADAAQIVHESGATLVGTPEHCDQVRQQAAATYQDRSVACIAAAPRGAAYGTISHPSLIPGVKATTVTVVHSGAQAPDPSDTGGLHQPLVPPNDFSVIANHPPTPRDVAFLGTHQTDKENGDLLYHLRIGNFTLAMHDTSGPNKEVAPKVYDAIRSLPKTDVEVASVQGFGQITNGGRDFRLIVEALRPQELVPGHHDNWLPGLSTRGELYRPYVVDELSRIPAAQRPVLHWVQDRDDYLKPMIWKINDPRWR